MLRSAGNDGTVGGKELKKVCPLIGILDARKSALEIFCGYVSIANEMLPPPKL